MILISPGLIEYFGCMFPSTVYIQFKRRYSDTHNTISDIMWDYCIDCIASESATCQKYTPDLSAHVNKSCPQLLPPCYLGVVSLAPMLLDLLLDCRCCAANRTIPLSCVQVCCFMEEISFRLWHQEPCSIFILASVR